MKINQTMAKERRVRENGFGDQKKEDDDRKTPVVVPTTT
jgi:hypothetical protein